MDSLTLERTPAQELRDSLFQVVTDPSQSDSLHKLLGAFCHQSRNVLNSMKMSFYLAKRDHHDPTTDFWCDLEPGYRIIELYFDRLQAICRPVSLLPLNVSLEMLIDERRQDWVKVMEQNRRALRFIEPAEATKGHYDPNRLRDGLDAFIQWRAMSGPPDTEATLAWACVDGRFVMEWIEEGGAEIDSSASDDGPATLSLPYLARVISAHGGTLDLDFSQGLHLRIQWPAAPSTRR
ncbi:hypothetical protein [Singulisphaera sp. PoT]|uniref:hypothetical protein n=1 Tax=Singulisphaera sp. PoT TaxID=3411797 RepID=UPI003BF55009